MFDGFEVYVSRFGIDGAEKSAWIEESIDVSECSTELHVGCVAPVADPSTSTLRSHFHGTLLATPEERITISLKSSPRQIVMQIRTCSSVLYEEVLTATTAFPGSCCVWRVRRSLLVHGGTLHDGAPLHPTH